MIWCCFVIITSLRGRCKFWIFCRTIDKMPIVCHIATPRLFCIIAWSQCVLPMCLRTLWCVVLAFLALYLLLSQFCDRCSCLSLADITPSPSVMLLLLLPFGCSLLLLYVPHPLWVCFYCNGQMSLGGNFQRLDWTRKHRTWLADPTPHQSFHRFWPVRNWAYSG